MSSIEHSLAQNYEEMGQAKGFVFEEEHLHLGVDF
jgi:hypothetical protein